MFTDYTIFVIFAEGSKKFFCESRAFARGESGVSEWFDVTVCLRQGCVISSWLFNMYIDGVIKEVNARAQGRGVQFLG